LATPAKDTQIKTQIKKNKHYLFLAMDFIGQNEIERFKLE
jgi:hypothetical protein